ncbi:hypothetical protein FHR75_001495 [Kineococcus radiotolerans]|uniref:Uncharacterized protein n=2 Tax=Kineococcus radiotolerans TaxID=131568 RepID=A6W5P0_KINRD|nr:hypothetical protein [Kineococcus radiotolerans]ABS02129.1 hypothetical protein Krad_0640 [Kineococcus radiotolerans SRS30216 = ATCC BAA-149]MBB2900707.1 hypothetical protein [Kineococcus radiotolerans]
MTRQPWWRATQTLEQSKRSGILYVVLAALSWALALDGRGPLAWLAAVVFTVVGAYFLAAWRVRRSREGDGTD